MWLGSSSPLPEEFKTRDLRLFRAFCAVVLVTHEYLLVKLSVMPEKRDRGNGDSPPHKKAASESTLDTTRQSDCCVKCGKSVHSDGVQCERCSNWEHRDCAGLSKSLYKALTGSPGSVMCFCSRCEPKVKLALKFFDEIEEKHKSLESKLQQLEERISKSFANTGEHLNASNSQPSSNVTSPDGNVQLISSKQTPSYAVIAATPEYNAADRKFNVVVYGIEECPNNTTRSDRIQSDLSKVVKTFSDLDDSIETNSIKDHFRLGKYQSNRQRPRPILVKFLRSSDALSILSKKKELQSSITIKPDMTKQERQIEQLLLKQRWQLLQSGYDRKQIKIRRNSLIVDNVVYAKVVDDKLVFSTTTEPRSTATTSATPNLAPTSQSMDLESTST